ncbi:MAG: enhanced serine sensitivity protein SseB C-terminal domain-containing protein, partial [Emergencia sp.]
LVPYQNDTKNVAALHSSEGEILLPAFTSQYELTREQTAWDNIGVMVLDDLKHIIIDLPAEVTGVVLNPFGKFLILRRAQLAEIDKEIEGMTLQRTDHPLPQILSPLKSYPIGIVEALGHFFEKNQGVTRAWILAARPDYKTPPHKLFVIEFFGDRRVLFPQVAKVIEPFMKPGESFELMKADRDLAREAGEKTAPIYVCK